MYMSPEQSAGKTTIKSDIYSLGATLYEAITLRPLYQGDSHFNLLYQIIHDFPIPPRQLNPDISPYLEAICLKCIHKKPKKRYQNFAELSRDLKNFKNRKPIIAAKYSKWNAFAYFLQRNTTVALFLSLLLCSTVVVIFAWQNERNEKFRAQNAERELAKKNIEIENKKMEVEAKNAEVEAKNAEVEAKNAEVEAKNIEVEVKNAEVEIKNIEEKLALVKNCLHTKNYVRALKQFDLAETALNEISDQSMQKNFPASLAQKKLDLMKKSQTLKNTCFGIKNYLVPIFHPSGSKTKKILKFLKNAKVVENTQSCPSILAIVDGNATKFYNVYTNELAYTINKVGTCVAFSTNSPSLAALGHRQGITFINFAESKEHNLAIPNLEYISILRFSPNSRMFVCKS